MMRSLEQDKLSKTRIVAGRVSSTGTINRGTGFTVVKTSTGTYTVRFNRGMIFNCVASAEASTYYIVDISIATDNSSVQIIVMNSVTGVGADVAFSFIATIFET